PVAPLALLELATLLRGQNKAAEAADILNQCRQQHEANLQKDPARSAWVALLQYHQGVALREAGKRPEARAVLNLAVTQAAGRPGPGAPGRLALALRWRPGRSCAQAPGPVAASRVSTLKPQPGRNRHPRG